MSVVEPDLTVEQRARLRRRRGWYTLAVGLMLFLSLVLPHVNLIGVNHFGKSLLLTGFYFLHVATETFPPPVDPTQLELGFNVLYLGIGLHEGGLLLSVATFWTLWPDEVNRWIYRMLVIGGWLLALSSPFVIWGWMLVNRAGVPAALGVAWIPLLLSGLAIIVGARRAKSRIDNTWYAANPELM